MSDHCGRIIVVLALSLSTAALLAGCVTRRQAAANAHAAFLAGQNAALRQQAQQAAQTPGVTVVGPVQNPHVPWVAGLTLAQAIATANYIGPQSPRSIVIVSRQGQHTTVNANVLLNGAPVPLRPGDMVELK